MLADILARNGFDEFFSRAAMRKAETYRAEGRVDIQEADEATRYVRAHVAGSGSNLYVVEISLKVTDGTLMDVIGDCDCPIGFNCKHVAATLLEIVAPEAKDQAVGWGHRPAAGRPSSPVLPSEIDAWLKQVDTAARGEDYPPEVTQRIFYLVHPREPGAATPGLAVSPISMRLLKDGSFAAKTARVNYSGLYNGTAPAFFRDSDVEIGRELLGAERAYDEPDLYRLRRAALLQRMIATGRAWWRTRTGEALQWGAPRPGRIAWREASRRGVGAVLTVEGAIALQAEPPVYVDPAAGVVGFIDTGLAPRLAYRLLSAPPIPRAHVAHVARRLAETLPALDPDMLPAPPAPAIKVEGEPVPVLRLTMWRNTATYRYYNSREQMPVARLSFRYGPAEIEAHRKEDRIEVFADGQVYDVNRHRSAEQRAQKRLTGLGFLRASQVEPSIATEERQSFAFRSGDEWLAFLHLHAAGLRAAGFEVLTDADFAYRIADADDAVDAELQSSGIDWFELALGIEIDGEKRDLTPVLAKLIADPRFDPEKLRAQGHVYVPLEDGRHIALAADRFVPLILALHGLRLNGALTETGARLSRADVVPLLGLENSSFAFKGADNLRRLAALLRAPEPEPVALPATFRAVLRPYQAYGLAWLDLLRESGLGGVLADDMGLGKTVQVLALLALEKARGNLKRPALVVAPTSLMTNWANEVSKFAPDLKLLVLHGADRKQSFATIPDHDLVLTTYPLIARDHAVLLAQHWHLAVLDEAQTIKNPDAATTKWLRGIQAEHRFCLTGTPMENHLGELWSIMSFANPGFLGDKASFARNWRTPVEKRGDTARAAQLARRVKPFLLRRTKAEVAADLPPKTEITESIVLEGAQRDLYDSIRLSMSKKVRKALDERGLAKSHIIILEALLRLRQACCDPALLALDDGIARPAAKLDRLAEMVEQLTGEGRKILVFSQFTSMIARIRTRFDAAGVTYSVLTGETRDRKGAIESFQQGRSDVFLISLKAGGVGLNLTAADTVIVFDPWWNPAVEEQAIDRAHRIGQDKPVFVHRLVAVGTIEEKMDELKARKRALADGLFDRDGGIGKALTAEDVTALFEA